MKDHTPEEYANLQGVHSLHASVYKQLPSGLRRVVASISLRHPAFPFGTSAWVLWRKNHSHLSAAGSVTLDMHDDWTSAEASDFDHLRLSETRKEHRPRDAFLNCEAILLFKEELTMSIMSLPYGIGISRSIKQL